MIKQEDLERYHIAATKLEADGTDCYHTLCKLYGEEVANFLIVAYCHRNVNDKRIWPEPEYVRPKVDEHLESIGILVKTIQGRDLGKSWWDNATDEERRGWLTSMGITGAMARQFMKRGKKSDQGRKNRG